MGRIVLTGNAPGTHRRGRAAVAAAAAAATDDDDDVANCFLSPLLPSSSFPISPLYEEVYMY